LGDPEYGGRQKWIKGIYDRERPFAQKLLSLIERQALHARKLGLVHPRTEEYREFDSSLPEDMAYLLSLLRA
jgi:23S rRNA pseudouridine1911/1915/1917 synthase